MTMNENVNKEGKGKRGDKDEENEKAENKK